MANRTGISLNSDDATDGIKTNLTMKSQHNGYVEINYWPTDDEISINGFIPAKYVLDDGNRGWSSVGRIKGNLCDLLKELRISPNKLREIADKIEKE